MLDDISFVVAVPERACIVGENGEGKSTLLRLIAGTIEETSGTIHMSNGVRTYYVPQEFLPAYMDVTAKEFVIAEAGHAMYGKVEEICKALGIRLGNYAEQKCSLLSGGQQKILALSIGIALRPDFLLLDEPENHLDIVTRKKLLGLLQDFRGGLLCISHDRYVIDILANKVLEVAQGKIFVSEGGYAEYRAARLRRIEGKQREFDTEEKRITQLEKAFIIARQKAFRGKETAAYHKIKEELAGLKQDHKDEKRAKDEFTKIKISSSKTELHASKLLVKAEDITYNYPGKKPLFKKLSFEIRVGGNVVLLGRNGAGKSTLLKLLQGTLTPESGAITWAPGIKAHFFDQHMAFDLTLSARQVVEDHYGCGDEKARAILGSVKFDLDRMERPLESLSGGERMRLKFAIVFGMNPDIIVLDEPTNHVDITTWDILLDQCNNTKATLVLVSHDEEFIEKLENKLFFVLSKSEFRVRHKSLDELLTELAETE